MKLEEKEKEIDENESASSDSEDAYLIDDFYSDADTPTQDATKDSLSHETKSQTSQQTVPEANKGTPQFKKETLIIEDDFDVEDSP